MRTHVTMLVVLAATAAARAQDRCTPVECVRRINLILPIERVSAPPSELVGTWEMGDQKWGLSGRTLYLFPDETYVSTEWTDILPETVFDAGRWQERDGVVRFSRDSSITWNPDHDRTWVWIRPEPYEDVSWLVGLKFGMRFLETSALPSSVRFIAYARQRVWRSASAADNAKRELMHRAWRPDYFARRTRRRTRG